MKDNEETFAFAQETEEMSYFVVSVIKPPASRLPPPRGPPPPPHPRPHPRLGLKLTLYRSPDGSPPVCWAYNHDRPSVIPAANFRRGRFAVVSSPRPGGAAERAGGRCGADGRCRGGAEGRIHHTAAACNQYAGSAATGGCLPCLPAPRINTHLYSPFRCIRPRAP